MTVYFNKAMKVILAVITCCSVSVAAEHSAAQPSDRFHSPKSIHHEWIGATPNTTAKSPCTFVFTHGLYGDGNQFRSYADAFLMFGCRSLLLTLPGHGEDQAASEKIRGEDWIQFLDLALISVAAVSENIYLVGQSTGGALSAVITHRATLADQPKYSIQGLWLIEPALRVRSGPGIGSCLFSNITSDVRSWPLMAGLFGVEIETKTPKISPRMGCQVDTIWRTHLLKQGLLSQESSQNYFDLIDATREAFEIFKIPVYVQNTIGDKMVDSRVLKASLENHRTVHYAETNSPKHGQVVIDNILPDRDIATLLQVGFRFPDVVLRRQARNFLEAIHSYRRAAERESERRENMFEYLMRYRDLPPKSSTLPCEAYIAVASSTRTTDSIIPEFNSCMLSLTKSSD